MKEPVTMHSLNLITDAPDKRLAVKLGAELRGLNKNVKQKDCFERFLGLSNFWEINSSTKKRQKISGYVSSPQSAKIKLQTEPPTAITLKL